MPFFAVTFRSIDSPLLPWPVSPVSPGLSTFGGVALPVPSSTNWNFGCEFGSFGSTPSSPAIVLQILQLKVEAAVLGSWLFFTTENVCGPSVATVFTMCNVPPERTL